MDARLFRSCWRLVYLRYQLGRLLNMLRLVFDTAAVRAKQI